MAGEKIFHPPSSKPEIVYALRKQFDFHLIGKSIYPVIEA